MQELILNVEHQSTLWPASPFAMIFLVRIFKKALSDVEQETNFYIVENLIALFAEVAECCAMGRDMEHAKPLPLFEDMIKEEYLWSEEYNEEDGGPFSDNLFYSFYYYSYEVLKTLKYKFQEHSKCGNAKIERKIEQLISMID